MPGISFHLIIKDRQLHPVICSAEKQKFITNCPILKDFEMKVDGNTFITTEKSTLFSCL